MLSCKLCGSTLNRKHIRKDGSMLCPVCGQIYWSKAVEAAIGRHVRMEKRKPAFGRI